MKKIFIFLFALSGTFQVFAEPVADSMGNGIETFTCPKGEELKMCGGANAELHNKFVTAMKKKDAQKAIQFWDAMIPSVDGTEKKDFSLGNYLANPLIGTLAPEGVAPMPERIFAKKSFKGGILYIGTNSIQDADFSLYYVGYMRYKADSEGGSIYFYNNQIAPTQSQQYKKYMQVYGSSDFTNFEKDLAKSFYRGKFGNTQVNALYQKMIQAIR